MNLTDTQIKRRIIKLNREFAESATFINSDGGLELSTSFDKAREACEGITRADIERAFRAPVHEVVADGLLDDFLA